MRGILLPAVLPPFLTPALLACAQLPHCPPVLPVPQPDQYLNTEPFMDAIAETFAAKRKAASS